MVPLRDFGNMKTVYCLFTLVFVFVSCGTTKLSVPQSGTVTSSISRVHSGVTTAQSQQSEIARQNVSARTTAQRIDNKDVFIEAYRKWKTSHP